MGGADRSEFRGGEETRSAALSEHFLLIGRHTFKTEKDSSIAHFSNRFTKKTEPLRGLNGQYATDSNDEPKFPLDINGSECTMNPIGNDPNKIFPLGYPITNDAKIIVPNVNNEPYLGIDPGEYL
ncbi:hypothetical protein AVEN_64832-1 [Araneus ventricosus]|uniref:Uncharacterized protein n=1 Tax=Araneus ventricosus TaxID=182803 RepID=A0A4Y2GMA4_ARAVE|nr:hypothetical protein AVEN_64832-1 [Araneus ventricosus]